MASLSPPEDAIDKKVSSIGFVRGCSPFFPARFFNCFSPSHHHQSPPPPTARGALLEGEELGLGPTGGISSQREFSIKLNSGNL